jgi:signal transduction histidine kinase
MPATNQTDLRLGHGYGKLEFRYTAAGFTSPEQVRFRRQLVGFDPDWVAADQLRTAVYPRLAPGQYKFRFTACNSDGVWNDQPVEVAFEVTPAFWQTIWFRVLTLLTFITIIVGGVRYRYVLKLRRKLHKLEQTQAVERERMRIARDIHDDLGARLTQMAFLSEMAAGEIGERSKTGERLEKVAQGSREAIRSLEEIVWAVNPRKDTLSDLVDYLSHYANEFFRPTEIRCRQDLPLIIPEKTLSAETRHHLFLACKEALNNIQKHAHASEVWLRLAISNSCLELTIEDNGIGFSTKLKPGNGLQNIQTRLAAIGGRFQLDSSPGKGTRVIMLFELPPGRL